MSVSKKGHLYQRGKSLQNDLRSLIIDEIVNEGGDIVNGYFPGNFATIASKFRVKYDTVVKIWRQFVANNDHERPKPRSAGVTILQTHDLDFIELLKTGKPSLTSGELLNEVNEYCDIPGGVSTVTINRAVRNCMHEGKWSRKRMTRPAAEKFTDDNIAYCQAFIDYVSTVDPYRLKFFDETGLKLPNVANPNYGHSLVGERCVEISRNVQSPNITLNLLCGLQNIMYANTVRGATNTVGFLQFFHEASQNFQPDGRPILEYGDHIIMDNCATHRFLGGEILGEWLDDIGCVLVYLPTYSPELNPIELVFNKLNTVLHRVEYQDLLRDNLHVAVYEALKQITPSDMRGFSIIEISLFLDNFVTVQLCCTKPNIIYQ